MTPQEELRAIDAELASMGGGQMSPQEELAKIDAELAGMDKGLGQPQLANAEMQEARDVAGGNVTAAPWEDFMKGLVATGPAGLLDVLSHAAKSHPVSVMSTLLSEKNKDSHMPHEPFAESASRKFHEISGTQAPLPGAEQSIAQTAGEFLSPVPGLSKIQAGMKGVKALGKGIAGAFGSSAAMHTLPNITKEGSMPEQIGKAIIGGSAGRGALNVAKQVPKVIPTRQNLARIASLGAEPNTEAFKLAEKHGIELPLSVGMKSKPLSSISNFLSNSMFSSKKFSDSYNRSNKSMVDAIKKNIDITAEGAPPSTASQNFKEFLVDEEKAAKVLKDAEYKKADAHLKPSDAVVPKNTIKSIHAMKEILTRDIQSPETRKVADYVVKLADRWGISPKETKLAKAWQSSEYSPEVMGKIVDSFENAKSVPITKLEGVRSELGQILGHKKEIYGMERWLKGIKGAISKDFETSTNKPYVAAKLKANKFYQETYASRFKEDLAKSVLTGETPLYTYGKLSGKDAAHNLDILERIAGETPKAKEVVDSLKKAKVREMFNKAFTDEGVNLGNFVRQFEKNEVSQELLQKLLGEKPYKDLSEISKIMRAQIESGKSMLNTSSTTYTASDLSILKKFGTEATVGITALFSGHPAVAAGALGAAATKVAIPNVVSRLLADPKFIQQARTFAIARKNGNMKHSGQLMEKLGERANEVLRASTYQPGKESKENKNNE